MSNSTMTGCAARRSPRQLTSITSTRSKLAGLGSTVVWLGEFTSLQCVLEDCFPLVLALSKCLECSVPYAAGWSRLSLIRLKRRNSRIT